MIQSYQQKLPWRKVLIQTDCTPLYLKRPGSFPTAIKQGMPKDSYHPKDFLSLCSNVLDIPTGFYNQDQID